MRTQPKCLSKMSKTVSDSKASECGRALANRRWHPYKKSSVRKGPFWERIKGSEANKKVTRRIPAKRVVTTKKTQTVEFDSKDGPVSFKAGPRRSTRKPKSNKDSIYVYNS